MKTPDRAARSHTAPRASRRDSKGKEASARPHGAHGKRRARDAQRSIPRNRLTLAALIDAVAVVKELRTRAEAEAAAANPPGGTRDPTKSEEEEARSWRGD